jgi:hypothetical protein
MRAPLTSMTLLSTTPPIGIVDWRGIDRRGRGEPGVTPERYVSWSSLQGVARSVGAEQIRHLNLTRAAGPAPVFGAQIPRPRRST